MENGSYENRKHNSNLKETIQMLEENIAVWDKKIESFKREISLVSNYDMNTNASDKCPYRKKCC